jgi:hypothetical protein
MRIEVRIDANELGAAIVQHVHHRSDCCGEASAIGSFAGTDTIGSSAASSCSLGVVMGILLTLLVGRLVEPNFIGRETKDGLRHAGTRCSALGAVESATYENGFVN